MDFLHFTAFFVVPLAMVSLFVWWAWRTKAISSELKIDVRAETRASLRKDNEWSFANGRVYLFDTSVVWMPQNLRLPGQPAAMELSFEDIRECYLGQREPLTLFQRPIVVETADTKWRLYIGPFFSALLGRAQKR